MTAKSEEGVTSLLHLLALLPSGRAQITVEGHPLVSVDADAKTVDVETDGLKEAGVRFSGLVREDRGMSNLLRESSKVTGVLFQLGWKVTLCAGGEKMLVMGRGVSRLTGHVSLNPLKLRKLLKVMK